MNRSPLMLRRVDAALNMARYYCLSIEPTLFGNAALVRRWGRIGTHGARIVEFHADASSARAALEKLAMAKRRRGYVAAGPAGAEPE
jgi:predicted DNA-binding WGR domain protein